MSSRRWKPDSSVAVIASTSSAPPHSSSRIAAALCPATAAVPWPMTRIASDRAGGQTLAAISGGKRALAHRGTQQPVDARRSWHAASCGSSPGDSPISLSRKCGASPRSMSRVVTSAVTTSASRDGQLACRRSARRRMPVELAGIGRRRARRSRRRARRPSARTAIGLLDHAVRLARHDVAVVGETDVQPLAAAVAARAASCTAQPALIAPIATDPSNADTVRRNDSTSSTPAARVPGDERRDHLGVGRDVLMDPELVLDPQVGVVVDVAVERGDDVRRLVDRPATLRARRC